MMKLKQFMFALVAMVLGFAMPTSAQKSVVSTLAELKEALANSNDIVVVGDITVDETIVVSEGTTVSVGTMVYVVSAENPYPGVTYNKTATKSGKISGNTFKVGYEISLDGGENWFTDTTDGKAQAVTVKKDGTKTISTSFQSAFTSAKCGEVVHMLKDAHVQSTNTSKNNGPLRSYYGLILEGNGHTIYTDVESSGASNEYSTIKFTSYLAGTGADVRPVLKNVTIDSQKNAKADLDIVSGDVTFTVSLYNVNLLNNTANATLSFISGTSMVINKSIVKLFDSSIPKWDAGSANAIEFYSGDYSLSFNGKCKVYGGTFSKDATNYLASRAKMSKVNNKYVVTCKEEKVETAPSVGTKVEGEVAEELVANEAVANVELPADVATFTVQLTAVETENEATTKVTFDVTPSNVVGDKISTPTEAITFRLPIPAAWSGKAKVSHEGAELGVYDIQEENGAKYVEVTSGSFSEFSVEPVAVVAKVGNNYYETLSAAFKAVTDDNQTVVICKDVTEELTGAYLRGNITTENGAKVTINLTNSNWVYCPYTFVLGENITMNVPALFYYAGGSVINGTVVAGAYYQRYAGTKLTINEPGSMTVTSETCIIRYMDGDADAGIYVVGDNNDETVGLKLAVAYFYQGMINAKDANIVAGTYWQTNEEDGQGSANLVLDNSTLTVTVYDHPAKATGNSTVTLTNGSVLDARNGGFTYGDNTALSVDEPSKIIGKNGVEVQLPVARINGKNYSTLQDAIEAAESGATIELLADVEASDVIMLGKSVSINGNNHKVTSSASRVFRLTTSNTEVTLNDVNMVSSAKVVYPNDIRGISIDANLQAVEMTLNNCSVDFTDASACDWTYAVNVSGNGTGHIVTVNGGIYEGANVINANGANNTIVVKDATLTSLYPNNDQYYGACIWVLQNQGSTVEATGNTFNGANAVAFNVGVGTSVTESNNDDNTKLYISSLKGQGTAESPYLINNVDELVFFRDHVNAGETKYNAEGKYVALGANIDLAGIDWSVNIGDDCNATFDGIFDGKNFTISNLTATETAKKADVYICTGLFGAIYGNAVVKNLTLENVTIDAPYAGNNVAAVVGFAYNAEGSIENVKVIGAININAPLATSVGAIVGYDYYGPSLKVVNCEVKGNDGSAIVGKSYVGGVVGYASSKIALKENTVENVSVTGTASVGAIAGIMLAGGSADGNTVKNVALSATGELWANSVAVVAGTITKGSVTAANTTVENVTVNGEEAPIVGGVLVEKPTTPIEKVQAKIGSVYFATIDAAMASNVNGVVDIFTDVTLNDSDANGYTFTKEAKVNGKLTYTREFSQYGSWNALYLPFEVPVADLLENYNIAYLNDVHSFDDNEDGEIDRYVMEHIKVKKGTLRANFPYLIYPKNEGAQNLTITIEDGATLCKAEENTVECSSVFTRYSVKGIYQPITGSDFAGKYALTPDGAWMMAREEDTLGAYRLVMTITDQNGEPVIIDQTKQSIRIAIRGEGDLTDLEEVELNTNGETLIFDLQGRRVTTPAKGGVYIVNGKKIYFNK